MTKEIDISEMMVYAKALHCGIRWQIIEVLRDGSKSSDEIFQALNEIRDKMPKNPEQCQGQCREDTVKELKKPSLYYHLRELESVGIIELDEYKPSKEGRAPEKVWKLNIEKLTINFK
jgi:DNA-binding transcriptional ArsR family regulator